MSHQMNQSLKTLKWMGFLFVLIVTISGCRPTLYNTSTSSVDTINDTAATTTSTVMEVATTEPSVEASASPSPSPSASSSSSSTAATVLTVSGPSSQLKGSCEAFTLTASNSAGTATGVSAVTSVALTGGSLSVFSTSDTCSAETTSLTLTLTRLESSQVFFHRSTNSGSITITPSATDFSGAALATSMSSGSWSTQALLTSTSPGVGFPFVSFFGGEFWAHYVDASNVVSLHRTLNGTWSDPETIQSGLTNLARPVVRTSDYGFVFAYSASDVADTGTAGMYGHYYQSSSGYSTQTHFDTTSSAASKGILSDSNANGDFVLTWVEGSTAYASIFSKASGSFSSAVNLNTGAAPALLLSAIYDDGTAIAFVHVSDLLKYAYFNGTAWQPIASLAENCGAMSIAKKNGSNSHLVCDVGGVLKETTHTAGATTVAALSAISNATTAGNFSNGMVTRLVKNIDGTLTLLYVNAATTENNVMISNPDHTWNAPTTLIGSAGGAITVNLLTADQQGNRFVMFDQASHLYTARYLAGSGWSDVVRVDSLSNATTGMTIVADPLGYAMITWKQTDANATTQFYYSIFQ